MNLFKRIIFIVFVILSFSNGTVLIYSQSDTINCKKYWHLRHRLVTKFVKPGLNPGESLPASKYTCGVSWATYPHKVVKKIEWYDATGQLGWYIGVLATEIELLQRSNRTNDKYFARLVEELFYALSAINRLDDVAEIIWSYAPDNCDTPINLVEPVLWDSVNGCWLAKPGSKVKSLRNGFCARTDGNSNLLEYFTDAVSINTGLVRPWVPSDTLFNPKSNDKTRAGWYGFYCLVPEVEGFTYRSNGYYPWSETSQDQIFGMLMGLMLAYEFVDEDVKWQDHSLNKMSKEIALNLLSIYDGWSIKNPVLPNRPLCNHGGNSFPFWQSVKKIKRYFVKDRKNRIRDQILLWGVVDCTTSYTVNRALFSLVASMANTTPNVDLCRYVLGDNFDWGFFYLLRRALYNPKLPKNPGCDYTLNEVKLDLNLCPFRGPHYDAFDYGENGDYVSSKRTSEKMYYEYTRQEMINNRPQKWCFNNRYANHCTPDDPNSKRFIVNNGEFNGLDYLLLYNLANIVFGIDAMGGNYLYGRDSYFNLK